MTRRFLLLLALLLVPSMAQAGLTKNYSGKNFNGENPLGVPRGEFAAAQEGMELIYQRKYSESLEVFEVAGIDFPDSPLGPVGRAIVYQAQMFENYDFSRDGAYKTEVAEATQIFKRIRRQRDRKSWNQFLEAVLLGMEAMYDVRHSDYLAAFNQAWDALELVKKVQRAEPDFHDPQLALGLYNYWRTVFTESVDGLPKFGDKRALGLQQMKQAKAKGLLAPAPASLCLTYSYMEQENWAEAETEALWARKRYPENLINEMTLGRVYRGAKKWTESLEAFANIQRFAPENTRVLWHIGETWYKSRKDNRSAFEAFKAYLETGPADEYKAHVQYRLGQVERRNRRYEQALYWLRAAEATNPKWKKPTERIAEVEAEQKRRDERRKAKYSEQRKKAGNPNAKQEYLERKKRAEER
jgi:TolA-binding protein